MSFIKQLIRIAPFPDETKSELLEKADTFSPEKKFEAEEACWQLISIQYYNDLRFVMQKAAFEMAMGQKTYTKEDYKKMEEEMFKQLLQKLNAVGDDQKIEDIKKQLAIHGKTNAS